MRFNWSWLRLIVLCLLVGALPFERIGSFTLNPTTGYPVVRISQLLLALLVLLSLPLLLTARRWLAWAPLRWLLAFGVWATFVTLRIGYRPLLAPLAVLWLLILGVGALAHYRFPPLVLKKLGWALSASAIGVGLFGLYQFVGNLAGLSNNWTGLRAAYGKSVFGFPRIQSTALEPLYYADYLLLPLSIGVAYVVARRYRTSKKLVLAFLLVGLNFVLTMSRGAFLAAGVALILLAILLWPELKALGRTRIRHLGIGLVTLALAALGLLLVSSWATYHNPFTGPRHFIDQFTTPALHSGSFSERSTGRQQAVAIWRSHPLTGVGIEGIRPYVQHYPQEHGPYVALNSHALELLAETGLPGALLYYGFLISLITASIRVVRQLPIGSTYRPWMAGLIAAVVAFHLQAQTFSGFFLTHIWVSMGLLAGLTLTARSSLRGVKT